jgi:PAS domain S-box-containing protein
MSHENANRLILLSELVLIIFLTFFALKVFNHQESLDESRADGKKMLILAYELRQSSEDLTNMARSYVTTKDATFKTAYYTILDIRNGEAPKPSRYSQVYWDLKPEDREKSHPAGERRSFKAIVESLPFTDEERQKLLLAEKESNALAQLEIEAFNLMNGLTRDGDGQFTIEGKADQQGAIGLLYSTEYHDAKHKIMQPIDDFMTMLDKRVSARDKELNTLIRRYQVMLAFATALLVLINLIIYRYLSKMNEKTQKELEAKVDARTADLMISQGELKRQKEEIETILQVLPIAVGYVDTDGKIYRLNQAFKTQIGYTEEEIPDYDHWMSRAYPDEAYARTLYEKWQQYIDQAMASADGRVQPDVYRITCKDGIERPFIIGGQYLRDGFIVTFVDITNEEEARQSLLEAKQEAERASAFKSEFLANMSHEIRTPMNGMLGFVERLEKAETDPERLKQFKIVRNSGSSLLAIINDILDFSKIESGKMSIEKHPFDLKELLESSNDIFASLASGKNITLHMIVDDVIPQHVLGDQTRLKQVIFNLMGNAVKFTREGGNITLQARFNEHESLLYIAVIDNGVGIAKENLAKIFEAFSQEDTSTTRRFGGTGLGLSISSRLVRLMGGELDVESSVGKGSKFYFELPVEVCVPEEHGSTDDAQTADNSLPLSGHLLVAEDNKTNQMLIGIILDDFGITYDIANDGAEAVLNFKLKPYDVILMDENMPIMNGIEATRHIRDLEAEESRPPTPIIAVTANAMAEDRQRFLDAGMDDYVSKPYTEDDIRIVLQKYLPH